ncbi:GNAT family N-acetyltransferase [Fluviicola chungangensis]|uniref:GNAT family N-acetyltransferase n=1 Tax=Fluviicola chungangensis TaxID=2597671 RepID=A0A556N7R5_9FLAO|nr:GNAT family N-acetyltransferase [Fluviicola chungangensis]TSJ48151.1 GNAT family N-acetyltransferase [Fluviicola chungangensis]
MISIENIQLGDNAAIAHLIREVLTEFGANKPGTVFTDPTTDNLFKLFQTKHAHYFVAKEQGIIIGGCGIYPTEGLPEGCIELVKLYVAKSHRGVGLGKMLMEKSISAAISEGYSEIYLETLPELHIAVGLYEHLGFEYLDHPYGDSGHFACDLWMRKLV